MVLVENGPWIGPVGVHLSALQTRLYDCIDAALQGQLAVKFPQSKGKRVVIQVDCYNVQRDEVEPFFDRFTSGVFSVGDYKDATDGNQFVSQIAFEILFDAIH
jgi:hypothetical protein